MQFLVLRSCILFILPFQFELQTASVAQMEMLNPHDDQTFLKKLSHQRFIATGKDPNEAFATESDSNETESADSFVLGDATKTVKEVKKVQPLDLTPSKEMLQAIKEHHIDDDVSTVSTNDSEWTDGFWDENSLKLTSYNMLMKMLGDVRIPRTMMLPNTMIPKPLDTNQLFYDVSTKLGDFYNPWHRATLNCGFTTGNLKRQPNGPNEDCAPNWFGPNCEEVRLVSLWSSRSLAQDAVDLCAEGADQPNDVQITVTNRSILAIVDGPNKTRIPKTLVPLSEALAQVLPVVLQNDASINYVTLANDIQDALATYNEDVMDWSVRESRIVNYLRAEESDMIGIVEFDVKNLDLGEEYTPLIYSAGKLGFFYKQSTGWQCEIVRSRAFRNNPSRKHFMIVKCDKDDRTMLISLAHLVSDPQDGDFAKRISHLKELDVEVKLMVRELDAENTDLILMGDMNIDLTEQGHVWSEALHKQDANQFSPHTKISFGGKGCILGNTETPVTSKTPQRTEMLDYFWISESVKGVKDVTPKWTPTFIPTATHPSDHIAISVQLGN